MNAGAGTGPGLKGVGSQNSADGTSTGDASPGSGTITATPSHSKNAAGITTVGPVDKAPFILAGLVVILTLTGTLLL